jgi:CII-binding regulator of phage lambda lysogenization HflD
MYTTDDISAVSEEYNELLAKLANVYLEIVTPLARKK